MKSPTVKPLVVTILIALAVVLTVLAANPGFSGTRKGKPDENYITSDNCRTCHEDHFASWRRTHHSRMTQEARPESVQGDFEKQNTLEYLGYRAKMERRGTGFFMTVTSPDGKTEAFKIVRTIGSRRIEQYVAERNGQFFRLPLAYDLMQRRWMSLNGSFFYPDGDNFNQHTTQWDTNCVYCHNVKAQPNFNFQTRQAKTEVAELGIACGACHAQGAEHADLATSPLRRALWSFSTHTDKKIVDPVKLDSDRSMMICAHCHGQRIPEPQERIREVMIADPFDAGEDLSLFYRPIHRETMVGNVSFASRFWDNGSPRLTAHEYQALTRSKCFTSGKTGDRINCLSCHAMHEGDVKGNITPEKRTNAACTQCHSKYDSPDTLASHTKHKADSAGSSCYSCHMPETVYGVMTFHPSHDITVPDPGLTASQSVPNACNQCHVDQSVNWAIAQSKSLWPERFRSVQVSSDKQFDEPEGVRGLFAGDALTRAMTANSLTKNSKPDFYLPLLAEAFADDKYPIVRYFAANGLAAANNNVAKPDYLANDAARTAQIGPWFVRVDAARRAEIKAIAARLIGARKDVDIEVGE